MPFILKFKIRLIFTALVVLSYSNILFSSTLTCNQLFRHVPSHTKINVIEEIQASGLNDFYFEKLVSRLYLADNVTVENALNLPFSKLKNILKKIDELPNLKSRFAFYNDTKATKDVLLIMSLVDPSNHTSGFLIYRFISGTEDVDKKMYFEFMKFERGNKFVAGVSDKTREVIMELARAANVTREETEADWLGRYVWAKKGYQFLEKNYYTFNGTPITQLELARNNLVGFLSLYRIKIEDLVKNIDGRVVKIESINDLIAPIDFALLTHKNGLKIKIKPYVDEGVLGEEQELDVGKAFMLAPYEKRIGQSSKILDETDNTYYSDIAMPVWHGYLPIK